MFVFLRLYFAKEQTIINISNFFHYAFQKTERLNIHFSSIVTKLQNISLPLSREIIT